MNLTGKYTVEITDKNGNKKVFQTKNTIVKHGIRQVLDWLSFDLYNQNSFQGIKKVPPEKISFPSNNIDTATSMYYPESVLDYDDGSDEKIYNNSCATIDDFRTGKQSITLNFKDGAIMLAAINLDAEMFSKPSEKNNESISFQIEYREINDVVWKKLPCNYTLINDGVRRQLTFFVCPNVPPFVYIPCTALKFTFDVKKNTLSNENNLIGKIYNISLFENNSIPQPPAVMKFGTGKDTDTVDEEEVNLIKPIYSQMVSYTQKNGNTVSYIVEIPKDKCNGVEISEIGMFYRYDYVNPTHQHIHQTEKNVNTMFSRALFTESWSKNEGEEIKISYDITVNNG